MLLNYLGEIMKLLKGLFGVLALLVFVNFTFAKSKKDFEHALSGIEVITKSFDTEEFYESIEFTNKKTKEKKKFSDFTPLQKSVFVVMQMDVINRSLGELYNKWMEELKKAKDKPDDPEEASKKDIRSYLARLLSHRKNGASKLESKMEQMFKKYPDDFTEEEQKHMLNMIREYNDKNKLIERKKDDK
jgi:hypothetical protein